MSIHAYVGIPGSGKSYEVVGTVILEAFCQGRKIVTNISGINLEAFIEYCETEKKIDSSKLGTIEIVSDADVLKDNFFPNTGIDDPICKPGSLICLDEIHKFWEKDSKLSAKAKEFFAEHRHFADPETKSTCDVVLITQSVKSIALFIRHRLESVFSMHKLIAVGKNNRFRVDIYGSSDLKPVNKISSYQKKYDKKIFALYKSHFVSGAVENIVDKRTNVFAQKSLWIKMILCVLFIFGAIYQVYGFLHPKSDKADIVNTESVNKASPQVNSDIPPLIKEPVYKLSSYWRITGELNNAKGKFIIIASKDGVIRLLDRDLFFGNDLTMYGIVDNEKVTYYSGV
ncbi:zonular occludens toxin domain-containing protein [Citrobacter portucalensis]|uniref:zonular occludens toxin domain-containing protein n=1 Tax=Citrobacter portucalensis TaxID=1639133 RepID=UPI0016477675|nr:zonular occludens toxin domain-containing protein [Citrobacter portucalensis]